MICTDNFIHEWLKENLTSERYEHSLGTAECAEILAKKYNLDSSKAYLAGLIHDCAKCLPKDKMNEIISKYVKLECEEVDNPKTYHAPAGVYIAQNELKINDQEILSAIRCHTIGKLDMTLFEKIIFLADKIENRTRPCECTKLMKLLDEPHGLDKALLICYKKTINSLIDRNMKICTTTVDIYNSLLQV